MMENRLDSRDLRLLLELEKNGRQGLGELAKKLGVSKEAAHYRLNKLLEQGIVTKLFAKWRPEVFGYENYSLYFRMDGLGEEEERRLREFLASRPETAWFAPSSGRFDLIARIFAKGTAGLHSFLSDFLKHFGQYVKEKQVTIRTKQIYLCAPRQLFEKLNPPEVLYEPQPSEEMKLDETDEKLLRALFENARASFVELGKEVGVTPQTARDRFDKLVEKNVLQGFGCWPDMQALGYSEYKVFLRLQYPTEEKLKEITQWCKNTSAAAFIVNCIGPWDMEIDFDARDAREFNDAVKQLRNRFKESITDVSWANFERGKVVHWP